MSKKVKRTERGWPGHFIAANHCLFRRNTLLEYGDKTIVVSTVGNMRVLSELEPVGAGRVYETMAFVADSSQYQDIDVAKQIQFKSKWVISEEEAKQKRHIIDRIANEMHEAVVEELTEAIVSDTLKFY